MLNEFANVRIYNPMKKEYVATPEFDYVTWKSLRGDGSDNIDGIPGVGDKTALKLVNDPDALEELLKRDTETSERFAKNVKLIRFKTFSREEMLEVTSSRPNRDWTAVKGRFNDFKFKSITDDKPWNKFVTTFDPLFGE
jgi:hypothetical protein